MKDVIFDAEYDIDQQPAGHITVAINTKDSEGENYEVWSSDDRMGRTYHALMLTPHEAMAELVRQTGFAFECGATSISVPMLRVKMQPGSLTNREVRQ